MPVTAAYTPADVAATLFHLLGVGPDAEFQDAEGRPYRMTQGTPIRALVARNPKVDWAALDEVVLGCANQAGEDNRNVARMALLLAGLTDAVPGVTVAVPDANPVPNAAAAEALGAGT